MLDEMYVLSHREEDKEKFEGMVSKALDAVMSSVKDGDAYSGTDPYVLRKQVADLGFLPDKGIGYDAALSKVKETILPNLLRTWSTNYMPHLHAPALTETIISELIIGIYNNSMDSWDQGPAATELEESMIHGLVKLFGYGSEGDGTFTSGGTQSNLSAITAAFNRFCNEKLHCDVRQKGLPECYRKLRLYTSEVSHFSMDKACHYLGLGYDAVRKIPVDASCRIDIDAFERMLKEDTEAGLIPFCAVATIGTTDFGSVDSVERMRPLCDRYGMHLHADAAYGSAAIMSDTYKDRLGKLGLADSITVDFHKMFLLPISCSVVLFKDGSIQKCFELHADYLNREEDEEDGYINLVGKSMQTTRRFDALKVFMAFQTRGREGFGKMIDTAIGNATYFYDRICSDSRFIAPVKPQLSSVVFARKSADGDDDSLNKRIRRQFLSEGTIIGQTVMGGRVMLKFTLLNPNLTHADIDSLIERILKV